MIKQRNGTIIPANLMIVSFFIFVFSWYDVAKVRIKVELYKFSIKIEDNGRNIWLILFFCLFLQKNKIELCLK